MSKGYPLDNYPTEDLEPRRSPNEPEILASATDVSMSSHSSTRNSNGSTYTQGTNRTTPICIESDDESGNLEHGHGILRVAQMLGSSQPLSRESQDALRGTKRSYNTMSRSQVQDGAHDYTKRTRTGMTSFEAAEGSEGSSEISPTSNIAPGSLRIPPNGPALHAATEDSSSPLTLIVTLQSLQLWNEEGENLQKILPFWYSHRVVRTNHRYPNPRQFIKSVVQELEDGSDTVLKDWLDGLDKPGQIGRDYTKFFLTCSTVGKAKSKPKLDLFSPNEDQQFRTLKEMLKPLGGLTADGAREITISFRDTTGVVKENLARLRDSVNDHVEDRIRSLEREVSKLRAKVSTIRTSVFPNVTSVEEVDTQVENLKSTGLEQVSANSIMFETFPRESGEEAMNETSTLSSTTEVSAEMIKPETYTTKKEKKPLRDDTPLENTSGSEIESLSLNSRMTRAKTRELKQE